MNRIEDKTKEIEQYLSELLAIVPETYEDYIEDYASKAACERYFEKIVEAVVDLAFLIRKDKKLRIPDDDNAMFVVLAENKMISFDLAKKLKDAKGMRNIIAHEYGDKIDDEKVYHSVSEELESDVREFLNSIKKVL